MSDSQHPTELPPSTPSGTTPSGTTPSGTTPSGASPSAPHTHLVLNALDDATARGALARCCGARAWVEAMLAKRPYPTYESLEAGIDEAFDGLTEDDWLEAFAAHPRIGESKARLRTFAHADDSAREQAGVDGAHLATLAALADGNRRYEACFGHVFLVCATGKSADEMLAILRSRLANRPEVERTVAATEQRKITRLRLAELR